MKQDYYFSDASISDDFQLILPVGTFHTRKYGEIEISDSDIKDMEANFKNKALSNRQPFIDIDHQGGVSNGWIENMEARADGLYAKVEWTDIGKANIENKRYRYFSTSFGDIKDIKTGDIIKNVVPSVALTNQPVIHTMPEVHLSEQGDIVTQIDKSKEVIMEFSEIKTFRFSEDEKTELLKSWGFSEKIETLEAEKTDLSDKITAKDEVIASKDKLITDLKSFKDEKELSEHAAVVDSAIEKGKIKTADKEKWVARLKKDFTEFSEMLNEIDDNTAVDMSNHGSAENEEKTDLSEKLKKFMPSKYFTKGDK